MTKQELDAKIEDINREEVSPEEKTRRINQVNTVYSNIQTQTAEAAKRKQQDAETSLKRDLKAAYMQNPVATEEDFERDYPLLKSEHLRSEALRKDSLARESSARVMRNAF